MYEYIITKLRTLGYEFPDGFTTEATAVESFTLGETTYVDTPEAEGQHYCWSRWYEGEPEPLTTSYSTDVKAWLLDRAMIEGILHEVSYLAKHSYTRRQQRA